MIYAQTNKQYKCHSGIFTALAIVFITLFSVASCEDSAGSGSSGGNSVPDPGKLITCDENTIQGSLITCTVDFEYNGTPYTFTKNLDTSKDESANIINIFLEQEDFDPDVNLEIAIDSTTYNFSDTTEEIFTANDGNKDFKFRVNIFRKPIIITTKPAANLENNYRTGEKVVYETSGADAVSIRRFVQTDYYYVPTIIEDTITDNPAPAFALYVKDAIPTPANIFKTPTRVLRNFTTDDGNTIFFTAIDDLVDDDDWGATPNAGLDSVANALTPETDYDLYWAVKADNGDFSGKLERITTSAAPTSNTEPADKHFKYFGNGGMATRPLTTTHPALLSVHPSGGSFVFETVGALPTDIEITNNNGINPLYNDTVAMKLNSGYGIHVFNVFNIFKKYGFMDISLQESINLNGNTVVITFTPFYEK